MALASGSDRTGPDGGRCLPWGEGETSGVAMPRCSPVDMVGQAADRTRPGMTMTAAHLEDECFHHLALEYRSSQEYLATLLEFARTGMARAEPVFVAVPGPAGELLRERLKPAAGQVIFADMARMGLNPARIIPAVRAFLDAHPGQRVRYIGEPAWPARSADELRETARHEALINSAFRDVPATILCPYDATALPSSVIADAWRTHPVILRQGSQQASPDYPGPGGLPPDCDSPLPEPPSRAARLRYAANLRSIRDLVASHAAQAGLTPGRSADLVLAVSEIAANTLRHTRNGGTLHVWRTPDSIICQLHDQGRITDPLAGRRRPTLDVLGGQGLWVVNQVCDLVELRSGRTGTTVRLHMRLRPA
jgi:anti-sigma regulatory factor (Ser/Thr protein kinase)